MNELQNEKITFAASQTHHLSVKYLSFLRAMASFQVNLLPCAESLKVQQEAPQKETRATKAPRTKAAPSFSDGCSMEAANAEETDEVKVEGPVKLGCSMEAANAEETDEVKVEGPVKVKGAAKAPRTKAAPSFSDGCSMEAANAEETDEVKVEGPVKLGCSMEAANAEETDEVKVEGPVKVKGAKPSPKTSKSKAASSSDGRKEDPIAEAEVAAVKLESAPKKGRAKQVKTAAAPVEALSSEGEPAKKAKSTKRSKAAELGEDADEASRPSKAAKLEGGLKKPSEAKVPHLGETGEILARATPITSKKGVRDAGRAAHPDMKIGSDFGPAYESACHRLLMESYEKAVAAKRKTLKAVDAM